MRPAPDDVRRAVMCRFQAWLGEPKDVYRVSYTHPSLDPQFMVWSFPSERGYLRFCTVGASSTITPGSQQEFGDALGVRYEYMMHGLEEQAAAIVDALFATAMTPYVRPGAMDAGVSFPLDPSMILAEAFGFGGMYVTYPYEDDSCIYTEDPCGQVKTEDLRVHTMWCIPIFASEREFIRAQGSDKFEQRMYEGRIQAWDVRRGELV